MCVRVCVRGRQVHAEWALLAAGGAAVLDWWLYVARRSPSPPLHLHNGHSDAHQLQGLMSLSRPPPPLCPPLSLSLCPSRPPGGQCIRYISLSGEIDVGPVLNQR